MIPLIRISLYLLLLPLCLSLRLSGDIRLYPNTQNSPSLYLLPFTLDAALPSQSYLLVTMDWYTTAVTPYNCLLVNSSISIACTNLATPTFPLTITSAQVLKFNPKITASRTIVILLNSNLLASTVYTLQLHLYNVVSNIQKISSNIEIYSMSSKGLFYEANTNFGPTINTFPNNNLMAVSILNTLSANSPGSITALKVEITISQAVPTDLSVLMFVMQFPFTFSVGSIPTSTASSLYATSPIALYSSPQIKYYEVVSPNIFMITFNEKFAVGRKFIIQINQIQNPFIIASTNISIYSLPFNSLTPLEAFEMLYPIATASYSLNLELGLPYDAPTLGPMSFYRYLWQYGQVKMTIPYPVPDGYSIRLQVLNAQFRQGTAYANFQTLEYTPTYTYSTRYIIISNMGPIAVGTLITITFQIYIQTSTLFQLNAYIDKDSVITAFTASKYVYYELAQGSGITTSSFFWNFYDSSFWWGQRVKSKSTIVQSEYLRVQIYQNIDPIATSAGSYIELYFSPNVIISSSFNQNLDCAIHQDLYQPTMTYHSCIVTIVRTPNYLKLTVKANANYLANVSNIFPYQSSTYFNLHNMAFTKSASNKYIYPVYCALFKSDVVNPVSYNYARIISAYPPYNTISGLSLQYISNMYSTTSGTNYQNYPGVLRLQSTTPSALNVVVQPNQQFTFVFHATYGFRSFPSIKNGQAYPCTSNIPIRCTFYAGTYGSNQLLRFDRVAVTFSDNSYSTTPFHILLPDMQFNQYDNHVYALAGFYDTLKKDWQYYSTENYYRYWGYWISTEAAAITSMGCDITGKAGSYRSNVSVTISNNAVQTGGVSFLFISTQWSFFQNGISGFSSSTLAMTSIATFGTNNRSPLGLYMTGGMYLTVIPFTYNAYNSNFNIYLDNVHMPYSYDLPTYYIYMVRQSDKQMVSSNQYIMMNGGTLYGSPLQSLSITCKDNSIGVANTYCTISFGTSNPFLASGNVRVVFSGMTIATNKCYLKTGGGVLIPTTCISSNDNKNVTVTLSGTGFYTAGNFSLVVYGVGITKNTLSQSITLYLYDDSIQYIIQSGVRIIMTTIASLDYISLTQIMYTYLNPLSYNTMQIQFYLPRVLYEDEEFAFVIGQDLSDVNSENARMKIVIKGQNFTLYPLFTIDNVNYLIIFSFTDPSQLTVGNYIMTIYGICTPASQANGAFNMIYRRTFDFTYTLVNSANIIFPVFDTLVTSDISVSTLFNTEGYKQQIDITIVNVNLNVNSQMIWIINFPSYFSPQLFEQDAYCMIDSTMIPCMADPTTPYQIIVKNSPKTVYAGNSYKISLVGIACPRRLYANNAYPSRFMFVGVLQNSASTSFAQRSLILPYQSIQTTVPGIISVVDMVGVSVTNLYSFSSIYAQFKLYCNVAISSGSYLYLDLPVQFDNLNNINLNTIIIYGTSLISSTAQVVNRRIQILMSISIPLKTEFRVDFPNLPTPKNPCNVLMSDMIATVTPANKLSILSASTQQSNSAPLLTFVRNARYISFNNDQSITITAGTYSTPIHITTNDNSPFLSNINIVLSSNGFTFNPSRIFLPIGVLSQKFIIGADTDLLPIVYFYQGTKQQQVNTNYQITLNMNIQVTNNPIPINFPSSLTMPKGGCTDPFLISLTNAPFADLVISYTYDNSLYSENQFFPNPLTTLSQLSFNSTVTNGTISFCSSSSFGATQVPIIFHLSGTNYRSYSISPSPTVLVNVINTVPNTAPVVTLALKNQQKTFIDVNFTNNANGIIFYHLQIGKDKSPFSVLQIQVHLKSNQWNLESQSDFMTRIFTTDRDNRVGSFYQAASTTPFRLDNLIPQTFYTLCAYLVNSFGVTSTSTCLQVSTMTWGSIIKASLRFTHALTAQELNNVICFFTLASGTSKYYLIDMQGNSCGDRAVSNAYYKYLGSSSVTQTKGTNIYLLTNPNLIGTDPAPLAFTNLFNSLGSLSSTALSAAQSSFSITYMTGTFINNYDISYFRSVDIVDPLIVYFSEPVYSGVASTLTINDIRLVGAEGTIYFILVLYKQIATQIDGSVQVNIRLNYPPTAEEILNCQKYQGNPTEGCGRAVYTGISPLSVTFSGVMANSMYYLYYFPSSQFPLRPIVSEEVYSQTIVTYLSDQSIRYMLVGFVLLALLWI